MANIYIVSYADAKFQKQQERLSRSIKKISSKYKIIEFSRNDINAIFYNDYKKILDQRKGGGYWLWKPHLLKRQLEELENGDYLFYCDSGAVLTNRIENLISDMEIVGQNIMGFQLPLIEEQWTKKELFINMECDNDIFRKSNQILASFILMKKSDESMEFIDSYLKYCIKEENITDLKSLVQNEAFIDHRHDQSIFSLLYKKYNYQSFRDPSQFGEFPDGYSGYRFVNYKYGELYRLPNNRYFRVEEKKNSTYPNTIFHLRQSGIYGYKWRFIAKVSFKNIVLLKKKIFK